METKHKRAIHHAWTKIRAVHPLYIGVALLLAATVSVLALRSNYQTMVNLREAVYRADETNGDVEGALRELRKHVHSHMNTSLTSGENSVKPPIQLKHTYERLVAAEQQKNKASSEQIYTEAQRHCEAVNPSGFSGGSRVPCIQEYVTNHGGGESQVAIPDSLYKFDFASPRWSADLAGWSLVLSAILAVLLLIRIVLPYVLKAFGIL